MSTENEFTVCDSKNSSGQSGIRWPAIGRYVPLGVIFLAFVSSVWAEDEFDRPPISYSTSSPDNSISRLQSRLDRGEFELSYDDDRGYLASVLKALDVPVESQMLVFSKTSLQVRHISPRTPRAIYFNDDVYIGYCQMGDVLEVSAVDPKLGTVFYTLDQQKSVQPKFDRKVEHCLVCHSSSRTEGIPGHLARSMFIDETGQPMFSAGSRTVDHTTPVELRWGGWYVTGTHGSQKHLGNLLVRTRVVQEPVDNSDGHNRLDLNDRIDVRPYLSSHSDIVALMVLEHQILVHNRLTKANFDTRQALEYDAMMNRLLKNPEGTRLESTTRRIKSTCDRLVESMLLVNEAKLTHPMRGTSGYAERFAKTGPFDAQGRTLRELDLSTRLFTYPCSYLIYSESFEGLPVETREYFWQRLWDVLSGTETSDKFAHLSHADRQAIIDILRGTKNDLPDYWKK